MRDEKCSLCRKKVKGEVRFEDAGEDGRVPGSILGPGDEL